MFKRSNWQRATARVVKSDYTVSYQAGGRPWHCTMILDVSPPDGEPFRTETKLNLLGFDQELRNLIPPSVGETLDVECDAKSQKVQVLVDPAHDRRVREQTRDGDWQATLNAQPSDTPPVQSVQVVNASGADPGTVLEKLERVKAQGLISQAQFDAAKAQLEGAAPPVQAPGTTEERLRQLDQLHSQHLISDAEHATERKRILDSL